MLPAKLSAVVHNHPFAWSILFFLKLIGSLFNPPHKLYCQDELEKAHSCHTMTVIEDASRPKAKVMP